MYCQAPTCIFLYDIDAQTWQEMGRSKGGMNSSSQFFSPARSKKCLHKKRYFLLCRPRTPTLAHSTNSLGQRPDEEVLLSHQMLSFQMLSHQMLSNCYHINCYHTKCPLSIHSASKLNIWDRYFPPDGKAAKCQIF